MKKRTFLLLGISTLITLSFTFTSLTNTQKVKDETQSTQNVINVPSGGFISEDKL